MDADRTAVLELRRWWGMHTALDKSTPIQFESTAKEAVVDMCLRCVPRRIQAAFQRHWRRAGISSGIPTSRPQSALRGCGCASRAMTKDLLPSLRRTPAGHETQQACAAVDFVICGSLVVLAGSVTWTHEVAWKSSKYLAASPEAAAYFVVAFLIVRTPLGQSRRLEVSPFIVPQLLSLFRSVRNPSSLRLQQRRMS